MDTNAKRIEKGARELLNSLVRYEAENLLVLSGQEPEETINNADIVLDTDNFSAPIKVKIEVDATYLDVTDTVYEDRVVKSVQFLSDGTPVLVVSPEEDDTIEDEVTANQITIDELVIVAHALETERLLCNIISKS